MATVPAWFNVDWYLTSKAGKDLPKDDGTQKTAEDVRVELANAGYVEAEGIFRHYEEWGKSEGVEPFDPATFDDQAYLEAKAANDNDGKTAADLLTELTEAGYTPLQHFLEFAAIEGTPYVPGGEVAPEEPGGEVSEVAAALDDYKAADEALGDALKAAEVENLDEAVDAVDAAGAAVTYPAGVSGTLNAKSSAEYDAAVIKEATDGHEKAVAKATEEASAKKGLPAAVDGMTAATEAYEDAIESTNSALANLEGALAKYIVDNKLAGPADHETACGTFTQNTGNYALGTADLTDKPVNWAGINLVTDGTAAIIVGNADTGKPELADGAKEKIGATEVLAAFNAYVSAINKVVDAQESLDEAVVDVLATEEVLTFDAATLTATDEGAGAVTDGKLYFDDEGNPYVWSANESKMWPADVTVVVDPSDGTTTGTAGTDITFNSDDDYVAEAIAGYDVGIAAQPVLSSYSVKPNGTDHAANVAAGEVTLLPAINDGAGNVTAPLADKLASAQLAYSDFLTEVDEFTTTKAEYTELAKLQEAYDKAEAAITDSAAEGGLGLNLLTKTTFTTGDDLFVATDDFAGKTLSKFGSSGEDMIFFGSEYTWVALDEKIENKQGDPAALEVFYQEDGGDLVLYIEELPTAGNGTTAEDTFSITLAGIKLDAVTFDGGFLIAGEPVA